MKKILVTGGCGFVGRHLVKKLSTEGDNEIWVVDDLSIGLHPSKWLSPVLVADETRSTKDFSFFSIEDSDSSIFFVNADFISLALSELGKQPANLSIELPNFDEVYHLASVVGGRNMIDNHPLAVGIDLAIDSAFFLWAAEKNRPERILYASSSAAYPISLQNSDEPPALKEEMIDFEKGLLQPDYTYGWSKLTGEFLARIAVKKYGLKVAIVRPFSGYGEDQDLTYPVPAIALRVAAHQNPIKIWGSGHQGRDFVHIDDCVEACTIACRGIEDASAVNIGSGKLTSFIELAKLYLDIEGFEAEVAGVEGKPVGVAQRYCDPSGMKEKLNWEPKISLRDGMKRVLDGAHARFNSGAKPE